MSDIYEFVDFRIDAGKRLLLRAGIPVPLASKAFDTLFLLVTHHEQVLEKQELMAEIWPDTAVEKKQSQPDYFGIAPHPRRDSRREPVYRNRPRQGLSIHRSGSCSKSDRSGRAPDTHQNWGSAV